MQTKIYAHHCTCKEANERFLGIKIQHDIRKNQDPTYALVPIERADLDDTCPYCGYYAFIAERLSDKEYTNKTRRLNG